MPGRQKMQNEKQQLLIILSIVLISFIGTSIAYPIFPPLFLHPTQGSIIPADWNNTLRSIFLGGALAAYPLGQFIGSPILGGCSDRYGRKRMLIISLSSCATGYLLTTFSILFSWIWILILSRFLTGFMEGNLAIVRAMAADLTTINKYKSFGRINGAASIGYVMGPIFGGFLSDNTLVSWFSYAVPFFLAALISCLTALLAARKLTETKRETAFPMVSIWQRFNLIRRFQFIFRHSETLKYLLIASFIFTLSVDIFYEFGPVYLTGLWAMTPAGIAMYNAALCISLAIGSGWLPHQLSKYFPMPHIIAGSIFAVALIFGLMVIWPTQLFAFILFGLAGFCIAIVTTNLTIQTSNAADTSIQGEAMGAQLGLRMLGDACICLAGGFIIISSFTLPIAISFMIAVFAGVLYAMRFLKLAVTVPN